MYCLCKILLKYNDIDMLKKTHGKKLYYANTNYKKAGVARARKTTRHKEGHY